MTLRPGARPATLPTASVVPSERARPTGPRAASPAPTSSPLVQPPRSAALPRASVSEATRNSGLRNPAVAAALFGVQGVGLLVGAPAHAADVPATSSEALAGRLAELEAKRDTMTPSELATARRALYSAYLRLESPAASTFPFEAEWKAAAPGSLDRSKVQAALTQLGAEGTEAKLVALHGAYADKLDMPARADLETAIAGRMLDAAAADGALDAADLTAVEGRLTTALGQGELPLLRAFPTHLDVLDDGAIAHLLARASSVQAHTPRIMSIVDELLAGKNVVVDVNADGKIDTGDVVLSAADGKSVVTRVSQSLADQTRVSKAMVDASEKMNSAGVPFAITTNHKANADFWTVGVGGTLELKPGVKPSEALEDIAQNPSKYGYECATGLVVVYYQAILDLIGPEDFDRIASDLILGPWQMEDSLASLMVNRHPKPGQGTETDLGDHTLVPGNYYYFRNWDVTDEARARGWQGENVIYLGEGRFYGHGIGLGDADMFVGKLSSEMKPGGKTPSLLNLDAILSTDVLKLDLAPGR